VTRYGENPSPRPARARRRRDEPREAALRVLSAVQDDGAYANLALPAELARRHLHGLDAAFATELTYGTLRAVGTHDDVLAQCVDRPLSEVDPVVLDALRLGVHQVLRMRVPVHAAVDTTVDLVGAHAGGGAAGFANAVMRRVARDDREGWLERIAPRRDDSPYLWLAAATDHPAWIVRAWRSALGNADPREVGGELERALLADDAPTSVHLVARPGRCDPRELADVGEPGPWSPWCVRMAGGDPGEVPAVRERRAGVQDEGSQVVALALAEAPLEGYDSRWLDLAAGPGGKAALLAALGEQRGARLVAGEVLPHRARLVAGALDGTGTTVVADGLRSPYRDGAFDRVLADVPCSGLGALRRRPEARWRKRPEDLARLHPIQIGLLHSALDATRPGGLVAYVTCSPHPTETGAVVHEVLAGRTDTEQVDAGAVVPAELADPSGRPDVQLWPHRHGTDAMYLALLRRRR
jgi:16S rRNA (cytosine967-C5)-methyltransferase